MTTDSHEDAINTVDLNKLVSTLTTDESVSCPTTPGITKSKPDADKGIVVSAKSGDGGTVVAESTSVVSDSTANVANSASIANAVDAGPVQVIDDYFAASSIAPVPPSPAREKTTGTDSSPIPRPTRVSADAAGEGKLVRKDSFAAIERLRTRSDSTIQDDIAAETAAALKQHHVTTKRRPSIAIIPPSATAGGTSRPHPASTPTTPTAARIAAASLLSPTDDTVSEGSQAPSDVVASLAPIAADELGPHDGEDTEFVGWDEHGFPLNPEYMERETRYRESQASAREAQAQRWNEYTKTKDYLTHKQSGTESKKLKRLVRGGIPNDLRGELWKSLSKCGQMSAQNPGYYQGLLESYRHNESKATKQIDNDLERTFPRHKVIDTPEYQRRLRRVLVAYSWRNPQVGYCQSMNFVCATALLFLSEEDTFWLMVKVSESILVDYYSKTMLGCQVDIRVLHDLLRQKVPRVAKHLEQHSLSPDMITMSWFLTIFVNDLPVDTMLRVWDCFLCEGVKVIFRIGLALFKLHEPRILETDNLGDLMACIRSMARESVDAEALFQFAFKGIGSLPMRRVKRFRETEKVGILQEAERLNAQRDSAKIKRRSWMVQ